MADWGRLGHLTPDQTRCIEQLMSARSADIAQVKYTVESMEDAALRFLRARQFDEAKTNILLTDCLERMKSGRSKEFSEMVCSADPFYFLFSRTATLILQGNAVTQ